MRRWYLGPWRTGRAPARVELHVGAAFGNDGAVVAVAHRAMATGGRATLLQRDQVVRAEPFENIAQIRVALVVSCCWRPVVVHREPMIPAAMD